MRSTTSPSSLVAVPRPQKPVVCVVDSQSADYETWRPLADDADVELVFCATAEQALRRQRESRVDLWVVNADLPHVSGTELCTMLKSGAHSGAVYLVANAYSATIERQALAARATLFACKPLHASLFDTWLSHQGQRRTAEARPLPAVREANSIR